jgi:replicative DNA helicase
VVSAALLDPQSVFGSGVAISANDFYDEARRYILGAAIAIHESGESVDVVSVAQRLLADNRLEAVGGTPGLAQYFDIELPRGDPERNARIVAQLAQVRRAVDFARKIVATGQTCEDVAQWLSDACAGFLELMNGTVSKRDTTSILAKMLDDECAAIGERQAGNVFGVRTGLNSLDKSIGGGLEDGSVYIVAGRPGMGKTAFGWQIAQAVAADGFGAAFISLEMTREKLARRVLAGDAEVPMADIGSGNLSHGQWQAIANARMRLSKLPLAVDDQPSLDHRGVRAAVQRCVRKLKVDKGFEGRLRCVVVDYLQLMAGSGNEATREQEVASNSRGLCELAKQLNCPIVALAQLNRGVESRNDKRPQMSDLRDSGAIEQDATGIFMLYRPDYYSADGPSKEGEVAEVLIRKQRNGAGGTVRVGFDGPHTKFYDLPSPDDGYDDMMDN